MTVLIAKPAWLRLSPDYTSELSAASVTSGMKRFMTTIFVFLALTAMATGGPILLVSDFSDPAKIGTLDLGTGVFTQTGTTDAGELVNGPGNGVYGFRENGDWVKVAANGATTFIGNSGLALDEPARLADGTIYATDINHDLYIINGLTGGATLVGSTGFVDPAGGAYAVSLISGQTNTLYAIATSIDLNTFVPIDHARLFQLDRATGAATYIANVANDAVTCSIVINGVTFMFDFFGGVSTLDLNTGAVNPLYDLSGSLSGFHGIAEVPEPSTWAMGVLGLSAVVLRRRFR